MIFFPLMSHPDTVFNIPSYNAREAMKTLADHFVQGDVKAKSTILRQKFRPGMQYSAQVLILGHPDSLKTIESKINVDKNKGDLRIQDPLVEAWIKIDEDVPYGAHPLFIVRADERLLPKVNPFFEEFLTQATNRKDSADHGR